MEKRGEEGKEKPEANIQVKAVCFRLSVQSAAAINKAENLDQNGIAQEFKGPTRDSDGHGSYY